MISDGGTGVSTYARSLIEAAKTIGRPAAILRAEATSQGAIRKWTAAAIAPMQLLEITRPLDRKVGGRLQGQDIFRRAHVHFTLRRRFMTLMPPSPLPFGIMHWTYPVPLRMAGWLNIYTVHDLIPLLHPELSSIRLARHVAVMRELSRVADQIVTVSQAARTDILSLSGFKEDMVSDCGQVAAAAPDHALPEAGLGLRTGGYFLFCGLVEPRKNLERLIEAHRRSETGLPLVIVGPNGWRAGSINRLAAQAQNVIRLEYVDRPVLLALIRDARALLFPSLAEGFGLPIIEAMQLGTPVLSSWGGALKEVAADAAFLINPLDTAALAEGISRLANDDCLTAALIKRGHDRAKHFSPDRFASRLAAVYDDTLIAYSRAGGRAGASC
jgi:glycosyltransferase involved in cell wall biosynthesis